MPASGRGRRPAPAHGAGTFSLTGGLVLRVDVEDAIGVHVEGDVDLGDAARRGRDAAQLELAQQVVVARARALALVDLPATCRAYAHT